MASAGAFVVAVLLGVFATGLFSLVARLRRMSGRRMGMVRSRLVLAVFVVLCRLAMMARRIVVRIGSGGMMLGRRMFTHVKPLKRFKGGHALMHETVCNPVCSGAKKIVADCQIGVALRWIRSPGGNARDTSCVQSPLRANLDVEQAGCAGSRFLRRAFNPSFRGRAKRAD
jgi:hypothetical protein